MPIVVAVNPTDPVAVVGPTIEADIVSTLRASWYGGSDWYLSASTYGDVDIKLASGWGVMAWGYADVFAYPGYAGNSHGFGFEIYRAIGNFEVGFFVNPYSLFPLDIQFGPTLRYETDTVEVQTGVGFGIWPTGRDVYTWADVTYQATPNLEVRGFFDLEYEDDGDLYANLDGEATLQLADGRYEIEGGFDLYYNNTNLQPFELYAGTYLAASLSERLKVYAYADADLLNGFDLDVAAGVELEMGAVTPWVEIGWDGGVWGEVGFDVKKPIGTGGLQLIGGASAFSYLNGNFGLFANVGLRYVIGEDDDEY